MTDAKFTLEVPTEVVDVVIAAADAVADSVVALDVAMRRMDELTRLTEEYGGYEELK